MPKFLAHVHLHDESGKLCSFAPGDVAPAWVKNHVGNHVLDKPFGGKAAPRPAQQGKKAEQKPEPKKTEDDGSENDPEGAEEVDEDDEESGSDGSNAELSFTGDNPVKEEE
ncbi:hypothetical protein ACLQ8T_06185 [Glutamicibacter sp. FR1]|uniref:hypothetical protein n=1 Tax=Glutamicibacter sp. FR1 TaxID=3393744 RepID=UPI0039B0E745